MSEPTNQGFGVRMLSRQDWARRNHYTRHMLFASMAASMTIVGAGAFVVSLWF